MSCEPTATQIDNTLRVLIHQIKEALSTSSIIEIQLSATLRLKTEKGIEVIDRPILLGSLFQPGTEQEDFINYPLNLILKRGDSK